MNFEVVIVGGGFFGCEIAFDLYKKGFKKIAIVEKNKSILKEASYVNQARIHNGYHYPRDILTAYRSHVNYYKFIKDYSPCVYKNFKKIYAIASTYSKTSANKFKNFCKFLKIPIKPTSKDILKLFNKYLIEDAFETEETAFDAIKLAKICKQKIKRTSINFLFDTKVEKFFKNGNLFHIFTNKKEIIKTKYLFIVTYATINNILNNSNLPLLPIKHELTEVVIIIPPSDLKKLGITVMDGSFFSTMPFPAEEAHSLTHVRFTPHKTYGVLPPDKIEKFETNYHLMIKDAQRYLPVIKDSKYKRSLFTLKTILLQTEESDGRPIVYKKDYQKVKNLFVIIGGKIDNIYDIKNKLNSDF
jgi:hypothetical protein